MKLGDLTLRGVIRVRRSELVSLVGVVATLAAGGVRAASCQRPDSALALETFDAAWTIVYRTHFDTTFNGVDWTAVRDELRPRVEAGVERSELRTVIRDMLSRLGQSHFALIPQEAADALDPADGTDVREQVGEAGLDFRLIGGQVVVTRVAPGGAAHAAGVRPGWAIHMVAGDTVAGIVETSAEVESRSPLPIIVWARVQRRLSGEPGDTIPVTFLGADDTPTATALVLRPASGEPVKFGNLPTFFARFASDEQALPDGGTAGVVWFSNWMGPLIRRLDEAVDRFRTADGLVIDLRGNGGGLGAMIMGIGGHFTAERVSLGTMRTRTTTLEFFTNPRRVSTTGSRVAPYDGPVAVLVDGMSASASEVFAGGMQAIGRVRVFGEPSAGAVLGATMDRLPSGDVLYHSFAEFITSDGTRLEGRGVIPDEPVALTRADLLAGRDPVLAAALQWIGAQRAEDHSP